MSSTDFEAEVVPTERLSTIEREWESLASHAAELNPFYEPWMLLPAMDALGIGSDVRVALVWSSKHADNKSRLLTGFFPFTSMRRWHGLPVSVTANLRHMYNFCGVPLLHRDHAGPTLDAYFNLMKLPASGSKIVRFSGLPVDGPFHQLLVDCLDERRLVHCVERRYTRALFKNPSDPAGYVSAQFSGRKLKHLRRQKALLAERGALAIRHLTPEESLTDWVDAFLMLEAGGWKGTAGSALASTQAHEVFFKTITRAAHRQQRLKMAAIWLDGRVVAARTAFRAGDGSYLFKIAYDEAYAKYSPGGLLEFECIIEGTGAGTTWEDSCTSADNSVYKRLWRDRRTIEDVSISLGSTGADFCLSVMPVLRFVNARLQRLRAKETTQRAPSAGEAPVTEEG